MGPSGIVGVDMDKGLGHYMAIADETVAELLASDNQLIALPKEYDQHFRIDLWAPRFPHHHPFSLLLFCNAYHLFLAGVRMALSGHPAAVFPLLRTALESAAYGALIAQRPELADVWGSRHKGEAARKACRRAFTFEKSIAHLKARERNIHALAVAAYEGAIDFGAHPNPKSVFYHVSIDEERDDGFKAVTVSSLYGTDHNYTIGGLCACLDFGLAIIGIIVLSCPTVSEKQMAGLNALNDAKNAATDPYMIPS